MIAELYPTWRLLLVGGKGGVGKTTVATGLALAASRWRPPTGPRPAVQLVSLDPAHSLGDVLGVDLHDSRRHPLAENLEAQEFAAEAALAAFREQHRPALSALLERGTLLDRSDTESFLNLSLPGMDELMAILELGRRWRDLPPHGWLIVDTAPTGHTLSLLRLTAELERWIAVFGAMQARHEAVQQGRRGRDRQGLAGDPVPPFLAQLREPLAAFRQALAPRGGGGLLLVTLPEPMALGETDRYLEALAELGVTVPAIAVNRAPLGEVPPRPLRWPAPRRLWAVPPCPTAAAQGPRAVAEAVAAIGLGATATEPTPEATTMAVAARPLPLASVLGPARLVLVAGKGGVGKTTIAAALALQLATAAPTAQHLLLSLDPAQALGRCLACDLSAEPALVAPGLLAATLDPARLLADFQADYNVAFRQLLEGLGGSAGSAVARDRGLRVAFDHEIISQLLERTPPGLDELLALHQARRLLADPTRYRVMVLDTAPTGHFLRLLELPDVIREWLEAALRLVLRYRQVLPLTEAGAKLVELARDVRALRQTLRDAALCRVLVVTRAEPVVLAETGRLVAALRRLEVPVAGLVHNAAAETSPTALAGWAPHWGVVPRQAAPPTGLAALRQLGTLAFTTGETPPVG